MPTLICNLACLKTYLLLHWPKIHLIFIHFVTLALGQILFIFTLKIINGRLKKIKIKQFGMHNTYWPAGKFYFFTNVNFENFSWGLCYRSLSTIELNCLKNQLETCGIAEWNFFLFFNLLNVIWVRLVMKKYRKLFMIYEL